MAGWVGWSVCEASPSRAREHFSRGAPMRPRSVHPVAAPPTSAAPSAAVSQREPQRPERGSRTAACLHQLYQYQSAPAIH